MLNHGKVCISLTPKTAEELFSQIGRSESLSDVIEIRFDHLDLGEIQKVLERVSSKKPLLFTFRPESQGGFAPDDPGQRFIFWLQVFSECPLDSSTVWIDNEYDFGSAFEWPPAHTIIRSFHDMKGVPEQLEKIYESLEALGGVIKIAVSSDDLADSIGLWRLLERAVSEGRQLIPIAMKETGKWTRILGLARGAFMTYASLETGAEAAPGQISAEDLHDVFRVKELDRETEVFGIIAGDTSYSVSPLMHNAAFKASGMNRVFVPLQCADIDEFISRMVRPATREIDLNFAGFSVTNPHKETIMRHLDSVDEDAARIGAVNTVKIENGNLKGFNTDAAGFIGPLKAAYGDLSGSYVSVVGAGGAARACIHSLQREGAKVSLIARNTKRAGKLARDFDVPFFAIKDAARPAATDIIVNATPLGTKGENEDRTIATADELKGTKLVYDLVYNPIDTRLISESRGAGIPTIGGLEMLIAQGARQFEIWTGESAPLEAMKAGVMKRLGL